MNKDEVIKLAVEAALIDQRDLDGCSVYALPESYVQAILQFAQRIEQPLQKRIAELEQELDYAKQAARVEADMYDQARVGMKQLRDALLHVRQSMYINDYGDWALEEGFNGFDITPIDRALEQTK